MSQLYTGLLIVGHGTRSERGLTELRDTVDLVARMAYPIPVAACFLELAEPTIERGIATLAAQGVERIVVLPLLLFAAGHAKEDIPEAVCAAAAQYPQMDFAFAMHLGCHERLLRLSGQRFADACTGREDVSPSDTLWLMVGRGSRDPSALAEMRQFVERRLSLTPVAQVRIAYLSMAEPTLPQALAEVAELRYQRVIVQPHLLFHGELLTTVETEVARMAERWPHQQWLVAPHCGVAELLAEAILDRFWETQLRGSLAR